jgi:hypothetical protein
MGVRKPIKENVCPGLRLSFTFHSTFTLRRRSRVNSASPSEGWRYEYTRPSKTAQAFV